jgi:hypothetical protein
MRRRRGYAELKAGGYPSWGRSGMYVCSALQIDRVRLQCVSELGKPFCARVLLIGSSAETLRIFVLRYRGVAFCPRKLEAVTRLVHHNFSGLAHLRPGFAHLDWSFGFSASSIGSLPDVDKVRGLSCI